MGFFWIALPLCQWTCLTPVTSLAGSVRSNPGPESGQGLLEVGAEKPFFTSLNKHLNNLQIKVNSLDIQLKLSF